MRSTVTWALAGVWLLLIIFGGLLMADPPWLRQLSQPGMEVESKSYKDYGDTLAYQGQYQSAVRQYLSALEINPDNIGALVNLAIVYGRTGAPDRGIELLEQALERDTLRPGTICFNIAQLLEGQGRTGEAAGWYRRALGTEVEESLIHRKLGVFQMDNGDLEGARASFELALAGQQDPFLSYRRMLHKARLSLAEDPDARREVEAELARPLDTDALAARYDLGLIERLNSRDRELAKTHNHLGLVCARLGDLDGAIDHYRASGRIWPGNEAAVKNLPVLERARADRGGAVAQASMASR